MLRGQYKITYFFLQVPYRSGLGLVQRSQQAFTDGLFVFFLFPPYSEQASVLTATGGE